MTATTDLHSLFQALVKVGAEGSPGPIMIAEAERLLDQAQPVDGLRDVLNEARDLLLETRQGSPARSAGHNARLAIERALALIDGPVMVERIKRAREDINMLKFQNVSCSQCGKDFGPGDSGYSHCDSHRSKEFCLICSQRIGTGACMCPEPPALDTAARVGDDGRDTYDQPKHGWTCFHCGETFTTPGRARDHFGGTPNSMAACRIKFGDEMGLLMELRKAEAALTSIPTPTGRAEGLEEALRFYADPNSWTTPDQVNRDEMFDTPVSADNYGDRARRALSSAPIPQAVTVDDAAVERVARAICNDLVEHWPEGDANRPEGDERQKYINRSWPQYECTARAALLAAFPQRREE